MNNTLTLEHSFFKSLFKFNLTTISGIIIAVAIYMFSNEERPIWGFLFSPSIYVISSMVAITIRLFLWLAIDKGTMYEISKLIRRSFGEVIVINLVVLSTLSFLFLLSIALS